MTLNRSPEAIELNTAFKCRWQNRGSDVYVRESNMNIFEYLNKDEKPFYTALSLRKSWSILSLYKLIPDGHMLHFPLQLKAVKHDQKVLDWINKKIPLC